MRFLRCRTAPGRLISDRRRNFRDHNRAIGSSRAQPKTLTAWASIPRRLRSATSGLSARGLRARGGSEGWSIQEYAHHLVEANLMASTIILAALGRPGSRYDWSWLIPDRRWMRRLGYDRTPLETAIKLLEALSAHVVGIVRGVPGSMKRHVRLVGSPGTRSRRTTLRQVLVEECGHANSHLRDIAAARNALAHRKPVR